MRAVSLLVDYGADTDCLLNVLGEEACVLFGVPHLPALNFY